MNELREDQITTSLLNINPRWAAPERLFPYKYNLEPHESFTKASDMYSLAMTIYEMMSDTIPFKTQPALMIANVVIEGGRPEHPGPAAVARGLVDPLWSFVEQAWNQRPELRPPIQALLNLLESPVLQAQAPAAQQGERSGHASSDTLEIPTTSDDLENDEEEEEEEGDTRTFVHWAQTLGTPILNIEPQEILVVIAGFADVSQGRLAGERTLVAIKPHRPAPEERYRGGVDPSIKRTSREAIVWHSLTPHPNILPLLGICLEANNNVALISPWMRQGHLRMYATAHPNRDYTPFVEDIKCGLAHIHSLNVVHGALIANNVFVDDNDRAVIASFAVATAGWEETEEEGDYDYAGYLPWMAPERLDPKAFGVRGRSPHPTREWDMYSLGMTIYEIMSLRTPFDPLTRAAIPLVVLQGRRPPYPSQAAVRRGLNLDLWKFIQRCWAQSPDERPTYQDLLATLPFDRRPVIPIRRHEPQVAEVAPQLAPLDIPDLHSWGKLTF
ncbi:kinase-like protein [Dacryopinax primogenitus]|uniref:Kinase-like protein n=1 Tax=Dacryopinax primogenitus (strain DJM 731) TaxID=1858805 RepID=M5G179_DACPD|nr:kinase-like protein [Dacryopinax primogenitus]EJU01935.1 kinase-like protein [Dacryopinax primogenitus]